MLLSVKNTDQAGFERNYNQLKAYYADSRYPPRAPTPVLNPTKTLNPSKISTLNADDALVLHASFLQTALGCVRARSALSDAGRR